VDLLHEAAAILDRDLIAGVHRRYQSLPDWITTQEAAEVSGFHPEYLCRLARLAKSAAVKKRTD
jgi:hypothetical protein